MPSTQSKAIGSNSSAWPAGGCCLRETSMVLAALESGLDSQWGQDVHIILWREGRLFSHQRTTKFGLAQWLNRLNLCLLNQDPIWTSVHILVVPLLIQLRAYDVWNQLRMTQVLWPLLTCEWPQISCCLWSGSAQVTITIWGVNQWLDLTLTFHLSFSL